jgi:predicted aldo/keto reductase-like oxidoreductase
MKPLAGGMIDNARIAFNYLFQFRDIVPIPGIEKVHEIEEIVQILEGHRMPTEAEQEEMLQLRQKLGTRFCHRCDYCQPCTEGIRISTVMVYPSFATRLPPARLFTGPTVAEAMEKAVDCSQCGECEERCPYHLPIREMMAEHLSQYQKQKSEYQKLSQQHK